MRLCPFGCHRLVVFAVSLLAESVFGQAHYHNHQHHPQNPCLSERRDPIYDHHHFLHSPDCPLNPYNQRRPIIPTLPALPLSKVLNLPSPVSNGDFFNQGISSHPAKLELGRLLFFDKILSGNRNISCATCHHPFAGTGDDLSLSVGEGANGTGRDRNLGLGANAVVQRIPRNAPPIFNLGAKEYVRLFHDGRVEVKNGKIVSPVGNQLPPGLDNQLAVQAMLPVTSDHEMAGQRGENKVATAAALKHFGGSGGVWNLLAERLRKQPEYVELFKRAFPRRVRSARDITFVQAANAIAEYEAVIYRTDNSPFDQYLRGNQHALSQNAISGMILFYGKARCATCHSGKFQTDHQFHAIAMPQIGPGREHGYRKMEDFGREEVTKRKSDRYKFRTPSLRNVAVTGPWGHDGAYSSLDGVIRHHLDPVTSLHHYSPNSAFFPRRADLDSTDFLIHNHSASRAAIARANELQPVRLTDGEIALLLSFLQALTDPRALNLREEIPDAVPSGLPVSDYVRFPEPTNRR